MNAIRVRVMRTTPTKPRRTEQAVTVWITTTGRRRPPAEDPSAKERDADAAPRR